MTDTLMPVAASSHCPLCGVLRDREYATRKFGWEQDDIPLPAAASLLITLRDLKPGSARAMVLRQCPLCATYYLYQTDYEYLANGSEDEEILTRLSNAEAAAYVL